MSKKIVTVTRQGVRESISGNAQELPSSAEFRVGEAVLVPPTTYVATSQTGTLTNESIVTVFGASVVALPEAPVVGQKVTLIGALTPGTAFGLTASHSINFLGPLGINMSSSYENFSRDFTFVTNGNLSIWVTPVALVDGPLGLTGTYTF